jgi:hypothetical protein
VLRTTILYNWRNCEFQTIYNYNCYLLFMLLISDPRSPTIFDITATIFNHNPNVTTTRFWRTTQETS